MSGLGRHKRKIYTFHGVTECIKNNRINKLK